MSNIAVGVLCLALIDNLEVVFSCTSHFVGKHAYTQLIFFPNSALKRLVVNIFPACGVGAFHSLVQLALHSGLNCYSCKPLQLHM